MFYQKLTSFTLIFLQVPFALPATLPQDYSTTLDKGASNITHYCRDSTHPITPGEIKMLQEQANAYQGIFWDVAYPGGNGLSGSKTDGGCDLDSYDILVEATRNAVSLADFRGTDLIREDRSFNKFFVRNSVAPIGGRWTSMEKEEKNRRDRVTYQCKDVEFSHAGFHGCEGGATAYTSNIKRSFLGWTIVFCPKFFSLKYLNEILARSSVPESSLGNLDLVSYEQVLLHEWLHNDIMGYTEHLVDVIDSIDDVSPKRKIYGMSEARDYAWKFMKGRLNTMKVNHVVASNVENYVWYFVDKLYGARWGWNGNGNAFQLKKIQLAEIKDAIVEQAPVQADTLDVGGETPDPATLPPAKWPADCHGDLLIDTIDTSALVCDYVVPPDDEPAPTTTASPSPLPVVKLPPDPKNCSCNESGCTPASPDCCADGTC
ncbi:Metalloproteases (zincins), catalytic [Glarea lozoyensis ATCC 20868]|uniref:Metalloproteases (Zincins), catalytic n=1 Tax=Glarea lozoyensis (strain ATCC 20868 / MF5171) TaxID=1116229 RepID=S3D7U8_GLAL2|nr:Metalloproteases (zincins), catalytic [Glarea lozoyensis ATCC 20868]EPE33194.1 Metalloproteases (zincins), catalytic [Glarea lozoyensis ATCC 20868]